MRSAQLFRNGNAFRVFRPFWDSSRTQKFGRTTVGQKDGEDPQYDPYEGNFSFTECDQYTKVSVIGAAGRVGKTLSLLLKTCPLIDHLCLFDTDKSVKGIGVDISHIDTKCSVSYVCGMRNIQQALNAPDVVIITAGCPATPQLNGRNLFEKNAPIIAGLSEACARFCPKACVILITSPINSLLPVVGSVYHIITNKIPSRKLFGLTTLDVVRANTFVAEVVRKDPNSIIVPVIGGTSRETLVPIFSQMKPCCKIKRGETVALTECLKRAEENLIDCQNCGTKGASSLSTAYAGFRFTTSLVMALKGAENIVECAFVKSNVIPELEYLSSPVKLGPRGIDYNFGYPPLSDFELSAFEQAVAVLIKDIELGKTFVSNIEDTIEKGLIWKKLNEESGKAMEEWKLEKTGKQHQNELRLRRKKKEEEEEEEEEEERKELAPLPTAVTQVVYAEGMQNWAARASFRKFFGGGEVQENCREISSNSISAELASGTCRDDPSLHGGKHFEDFTQANSWRNLVGKALKTSQPSRGYHTLKTKVPKQERDNYNRRYADSSQKMLIPMKDAVKIQNRARRRSQILTAGTPQYKNLNAIAKQKFRTYNVKKKFNPSPSFLFVEGKQKQTTGYMTPSVRRRVGDEYKSEEDIQEEEEEEDEGKNEDRPEPAKQVIVRKEDSRNIFLDQYYALKKENEELRQKIDEMILQKNLHRDQNASLEMERTKLEACWTVMSSTLDTFSNFCKKFTKLNLSIKAPEKEEPEKEEPNKNDQNEEVLDYEKRYYNFLEKLMEDKLESQLDERMKTRPKKRRREASLPVVAE